MGLIHGITWIFTFPSVFLTARSISDLWLVNSLFVDQISEKKKKETRGSISFEKINERRQKKRTTTTRKNHVQKEKRRKIDGKPIQYN